MVRWQTDHAFLFTASFHCLDTSFDQAIYKTFIVSQLKDAILGMLFLEKHQCCMDFQKSVVVMAGRERVCVDKFGRPLVGRVQVVQDCMVPGRSQATLRCRINCREIASLGAVEGMHGAIRLANSLNRLDCRQGLLVQCISPFTEPVRLSAGALVGKCYSIQGADVGLALETVADTQGNPIAPAEDQPRNIWLTCTMERVGTVQVVLKAKYWPNYSQSTVMPSVVVMETWA